MSIRSVIVVWLLGLAYKITKHGLAADQIQNAIDAEIKSERQ